MIKEMIEIAHNAMKKAYCPYSKLSAGAALKSSSGAVYSGCNVENVAYPERTCAEAGAIAARVRGGRYRKT